MNGFETEREFRAWQAAVARQYGIEAAPLSLPSLPDQREKNRGEFLKKKD